MNRRTIWEWSLDYVGDPLSWETRGAEINRWLLELGLQPTDHVLDVGCGNLSAGVSLIRYLVEGHYCGIDPGGWLIEAALERFPDLQHKQPLFRYDTDFSAGGFGRRFDFVVAHSVLSHAAHWQLPLALLNIRAAVEEGAVFLASLRLDQYNTYDRQWVYPGVSTFRLETVKAVGHEAGWHVEHIPAYRDRLVKVAPNDHHDWVKLTATMSASDANLLRLREEELARQEREVREIAEAEWRARMDADDEALVETAKR